MPFKEFIHKPEELKSLKGDVPVWHLYTSGIAGEKFLQGLVEGKFVGSRCDRCNELYIPPAIYCEDCFRPIKKYEPIDDETGYLASWTELYQDLEGNMLKKPRIVGLVIFENILGGLIHFIINTKEENLYIGMPLKPVWEKKRKGHILDIKGFEPG